MKKAKFAAISLILLSAVLFIAGGQSQRLPVGPFTEPVLVWRYLEINEIVKPANPLADKGRLYVKDSSGTTKLYFLDSSGIETDLLAGGGGGLLNASDITNGIQVTGSGPGIIDLNDGTYENTLHTSQAEGLSGADYRIGLAESLRTMIICDSGDIATDFGLAASTHPTLYIYGADADEYIKLETGTGFKDYIKASHHLNIENLTSGYSITIDSMTDINLEPERFCIAKLQKDNTSFAFFSFETSSANTEMTDTDGEQAFVNIAPRFDQTSTAGGIALLVDILEATFGDASAGAGYNALLDLRVSSVSKFHIDITGGIFPVGIKSGVDQSDAGAAAGELYVDTNDDNTIKIGV